MRKGASAPGASAKSLGGDAEHSPDVGGEVALIGEAHGRGDLGDGEVGAGEQGLGPLDAPADDVLVRRESGGRFERARSGRGLACAALAISVSVNFRERSSFTQSVACPSARLEKPPSRSAFRREPRHSEEW